MPAVPAPSPLTAFTLDDLRTRHSVKWREFPEDVLPMHIAEMDTPLAPPIADALTRAIAQGDTGYATTGRLPEAFAAFAARRFGWRPDPAAMRLVPDVMAGILEVLGVVTEPGDRVLFNTPGYPPYFSCLPGMGREIVTNPLVRDDTGYRLDLDRLERDLASGVRAYLLCNPHNPTGAVFPEEDLKAVADLAARYGVQVLSDEIHAPLVHPGSVHVPFPSLDAPAAASSVAFHSASKAWNLAGLKASLVVPGPDARAVGAAIREEIEESAGLLGVLAAEAAFAHGEPWLDELVTALAGNHRHLAALLDEHLPAVRHHRPQAGYLAWLDLRALDLGTDPARHFLDHARIGLSSGPRFAPEGDPDQVGRGFARLNFATRPDLLTGAVQRMSATL
ncbi:MalY/PatB family protein [Actinomadura harenae]|uniref:cysteine-S-conjugate beta-lyase n=1 Tax=Actinomadura harenae TaxID=2483351 RepID=A0A3M2LSG7_9ACTN|nr:aminotransferase class I/II-fold pyridoxal phosphate-dependent enzyme [Actinomadura harenae]RMI40419.1 aminotransferase class I/II-fold pyridoxal phosphate-dependent enzyme [Actinomadura harenae]